MATNEKAKETSKMFFPVRRNRDSGGESSNTAPHVRMHDPSTETKNQEQIGAAEGQTSPISGCIFGIDASSEVADANVPMQAVAMLGGDDCRQDLDGDSEGVTEQAATAPTPTQVTQDSPRASPWTARKLRAGERHLEDSAAKVAVVYQRQVALRGHDTLLKGRTCQTSGCARAARLHCSTCAPGGVSVCLECGRLAHSSCADMHNLQEVQGPWVSRVCGRSLVPRVTWKSNVCPNCHHDCSVQGSHDSMASNAPNMLQTPDEQVTVIGIDGDIEVNVAQYTCPSCNSFVGAEAAHWDCINGDYQVGEATRGRAGPIWFKRSLLRHLLNLKEGSGFGLSLEAMFQSLRLQSMHIEASVSLRPSAHGAQCTSSVDSDMDGESPSGGESDPEEQVASPKATAVVADNRHGGIKSGVRHALCAAIRALQLERHMHNGCTLSSGRTNGK